MQSINNTPPGRVELISLRRLLDGLTDVLMVLGALSILLMMIQITLEVALRTLFKDTIPGTEEIVSTYYMIGCAFLPLAWVQRQRGHVIVELFTVWMPPRAAAALDGVVTLVCAAAIAIFFFAGVEKAIAMTAQGEILIAMIDVVVWPSRWLLPAGLGTMLLYMLLHAFGDLSWAAKGGERPFPSATGTTH
ncbi:MAG: TRAP transporter small permease [Reyranellaceae bacterium]